MAHGGVVVFTSSATNIFFLSGCKMVGASLFPLTVHNNSNEELLCRYMRQGQAGSGEVRIEPRGAAMIRDAYAGMTLYASNSYDPSSPFAMLRVSQSDIDDVHFTESAGGLGRGSPVGPPERASAPKKGRAKPASAQPVVEEQKLPGDNERGDHQGVSLHLAHNEDLTQQGETSGTASVTDAASLSSTGGDGEGGGGDKIFVPGLGHVPRAGLPAEVVRQLEERAAEQEQYGQQAAAAEATPAYPNYDDQRYGMQPLPPVRVQPVFFSTEESSRLTAPERFLARHMTRWIPVFSQQSCETCIRPLLIAIGLLSVFIGVSWLRRRRRAAVAGGGRQIGRRRR